MRSVLRRPCHRSLPVPSPARIGRRPSGIRSAAYHDALSTKHRPTHHQPLSRTGASSFTFTASFLHAHSWYSFRARLCSDGERVRVPPSRRVFLAGAYTLDLPRSFSLPSIHRSCDVAPAAFRLCVVDPKPLPIPSSAVKSIQFVPAEWTRALHRRASGPR